MPLRPISVLAVACAVALLGVAAVQAQAPSPTRSGVGASKPMPAASEALLHSVRRAIADYFGMSIDEINEQTDLLRDVHADAMDAYEVVAMLCRELGVVVPTRDDLTRVGAIAEYLRTAPTVQPAIALRGSGQATGVEPKPEQVASRIVFYATDRRPTGRTAPDEYFGSDRQSGDHLNYGTLVVTIPLAVHRLGQEEEPAWYRLEWSEDPAKHVVLKSIRPLDRDAFFGEMRERARDSTLDTFVFVHGYNVSFGRAARRAAQISYDLDFRGVPILYSWPSAGKLTAYFSDRESAEWSAPHLAQFVGDILRQVRGSRVHLLAHSMGNQTLIRALNEIALRRGAEEQPLFENIVLAAPDFDAQAFVDQIAPRVVSLSRRWTLYASDKDHALDAAGALSAPRLGLPLPIARGVDTVDASGIEVSPWSVPEFHTYFASKQRVISDLTQVLHGLAPDRRQLLRRSRGDLPYWSLPPVAMP
jgi:esterase/lipase superfamily enzyme/acyl carrier protein